MRLRHLGYALCGLQVRLFPERATPLAATPCGGYASCGHALSGMRQVRLRPMRANPGAATPCAGYASCGYALSEDQSFVGVDSECWKWHGASLAKGKARP